MSLDPEYVQTLTGLSSFNASVNGARAEDWLAMSRFILYKRNWRPRLFILGADIRSFQVGAPSLMKGFRPLGSLVQDYSLSGEGIRFWKIWTSLLSLQKFQDSLKVLILEWFLGWPEVRGWYRKDGFLINQSQIENDRSSLKFKIGETNQIYRSDVFGSSAELDLDRLKDFEVFWRLSREQKVRLVVFIPPFHPSTRQVLEADGIYPELKREVLAYLKRFENSGNFRLYDLSEIESFRGKKEDFYDGEHIRRENGNRLLNYLIEDSKILQQNVVQ